MLNVVLGAIAGPATFAVTATPNNGPAAQATLAVIAGSFVGTVLVNTAFGPTCRCHILTAVHEEPLHCLGRLYTAQRVVEYLRAVIEGVQGPAGDMSDGTASTAQRVERAADRREIASIQRKDSGRLHAALFVALLVDALLGTIVIFARDAFPPGLSLLSNVTIITLVCAQPFVNAIVTCPAPARSHLGALIFNILMFATECTWRYS